MLITTTNILEVCWTGLNKEVLLKFLNKTNEDFLFIENTDPTSCLEEQFLLYINSLGGYIKPSSDLFIFQERVYLKKSPF